MNVIQKIIENKNIELKHDWLSIYGQFFNVKRYISIEQTTLNDGLIINFQTTDFFGIKTVIYQNETVIKYEDVVITINKGFY